MKHGLLIALACLLYSGVVSAEIYKWVDEKGEPHYQDHPRGKITGISMDAKGSKDESVQAKKAKTRKLLKDMSRARKQREKQRHKKLLEQHKQEAKCLKMRSKLRRAEAKLDKDYSEFSNDRPASYAGKKAELNERRKYFDKYCN